MTSRVNLYEHGYELVASRLKSAAAATAGQHVLCVRGDGSVRIYKASEMLPPRDLECRIGTYTRDVPVDWIEDDLIAHMRDRTRKN